MENSTKPFDKAQGKPKIAIYDFTNCEGCEVAIISLREKLLALEERLDIVDWRLVQERKEQGPFLASIIEGTPITPGEIETLKYLRENSTYIFALGGCASLAGIPGIIEKEQREKFYKQIYGGQYKPIGIDAVPLSAYVKVDFSIHGCPVNPHEVVGIIEELLAGKKPRYRGYSVCFECKLAGNPCRIAVLNKPCLGPIGQGGCNAICVSGGSPCYACFGPREDANFAALIVILKNLTDKAEIERYFTMFYRRMPEWQEKAKGLLE
jgi:coenzyme F420-reducing hydrogenase gamma subunit